MPNKDQFDLDDSIAAVVIMATIVSTFKSQISDQIRQKMPYGDFFFSWTNFFEGVYILLGDILGKI